MNNNLYQLLCITPDADAQAIKKAFRLRAQEIHPDRNHEDRAAQQRFQELYQAYRVLADPEKRREYDQLRGNGKSSGLRLSKLLSLSKLDDSISSVFDTIFKSPQPGRGKSRRPGIGKNLDADMTISFRTAIFGGQQEITLHRDESCRNCRGSGQVKAIPCIVCQGKGFRKSKRSLLATIPPAIQDKEIIRLRGEGEAGINGGPAGDLRIQIHIEKDKDFQRAGNEIHSVKNITLEQAILGGKIKINTLQGQVEINLPPGTQPSTSITLEGKGIPLSGTKHHGDHIAAIQIEIPEKLTTQQRELFLKFSRSL